MASASHAHAQDSNTVLEFRYTPTARAQVAIWIEDASGTFLRTVALTQAVAYRGIGNRPGASEMNSGYRWPYGRREGALPIWAHRRAKAPAAKLFPRVIFQNRSEGAGTRATLDYSVDAYYCLQFDMSLSSREKLDAVSCASVFTSDKGRYLTAADVAKGYAEPWQEVGRDAGVMRPLDIGSVYPPRMDVTRCTANECFDHADVAKFAQDARDVMPDIDAVTRATAPGDAPQRILFNVPASWGPGDYSAFIEVNVEGDYNPHWNNLTYPTPALPDNGWDMYARFYGYAYRGQPSVAYQVRLSLPGDGGATFSTDAAAGRSSWDYAQSNYGQLEPISLASDDPTALSDATGSGVDRLRRASDGTRFSVAVRKAGQVDAPAVVDAGTDSGVATPADAGVVDAAPPVSVNADVVGPARELSLRQHPNELRSHTWIVMRFLAARSELPIHEYEVRLATEPIEDETSFIQVGRPAKNASDDPEGATALMPPVNVAAGEAIEVAVGDLVATTHYYVAVRATDELNRHGPISVAEITTTSRKFATVTPCFVASAAYGTPLAAEIGVLRRVRDRYLLSVAPGRVLVQAYYALGPSAAQFVARHAALRSALRWVLGRAVGALRALDAS